MIIGFTGTRIGMDDYQRANLIMELEGLPTSNLAIHGGCIGSDTEFHYICEEWDIPLEIYPGYSMKNPTDLSMRADLQAQMIHSPNTHFARNRVIVERCDLLFACPLNDNRRGGTWYTINYAKQCLVPTIIFKREY